MSALGTHEITAGMSLGLEPPLSPPVVRGPLASAMPTGDGLAGLPTPPPAIRPPESAPTAPAPSPVAEAPLQSEPAPAAAPAPAPVQPEPAIPAPAVEPVQVQPEPPAVAPEPELPAMSPPELAPMAPPEPEQAAPVIDYFASDTTPAEPAPEAAPAEELPAVETAPAVELHAIPLMSPDPTPAPAPEPEVELPPLAPLEQQPAFEPEPAALVAPKPVELEPIALDPEPEPVEEAVELELPVVESFAVADPFLVDDEPAVAEATPASDIDELFAPKRGAFNVVVRLKDAEGVEVGSFRDFGTAMEGAQEVIEQFSNATEGQWPFYAGRFIRPDLIVSVDVVEG
jgi:hypothetical protein